MYEPRRHLRFFGAIWDSSWISRLPRREVQDLDRKNYQRVELFKALAHSDYQGDIMPNIKAYAALEASGKLQPHDYDPGELSHDHVEIAVEACGLGILKAVSTVRHAYQGGINAVVKA